MEKLNEVTKRKTALEHFKDIKELETADGPKVTVEDLLPYKCEKVEQALTELKAIKEAKSSEAMEELEQNIKDRIILAEDRQLKLCATIKQSLLKTQELEKENEILREIIKGLFDNGCPLHQYNNKYFGLSIEVDTEFSLMHLGKFKDVDLDEKLKEVLE